jgi:methionine-rich copper-binding protein CopC
MTRRTGRRLSRLSAAVLPVLALLFVSADPASAHSKLIRSTPVAGATVTGVSTLELQFSGVVNESLSSIEVRDAAAGKVSGDNVQYVAGKKDTLSTTIRLGNGEHSVKWRAVFADGHALDGSYSFIAGAPAVSTTSTSVVVAPTQSETPSTTTSTTVPSKSSTEAHAGMDHSSHAANGGTETAVLAAAASPETVTETQAILVILGAFVLLSVGSIALLWRLQN